MNGEIEQMSSIVCCARKALYDNKDIEFTTTKVVRSIKFVFSSPYAIWRANEANSVQKWYKICKKRGLCDIKFIIPTETNHRHLLGFANTSQCLIVCFWKRNVFLLSIDLALLLFSIELYFCLKRRYSV